MPEKFDVSFFIPVYRPRLAWLDTAVRSIVKLIRQSECRVELLLGDDGSPDGIFPALSEYEREFSGAVRAFHFPENRGVGAASCRLAELSGGRYIASFDQDDVMLPFDLDRVVKILDGHPEYGASYARKYLFDDNGLTGEVHGEGFSPFLEFFQPRININAMLIRREVLFAHGNYRPLPYSRINHDVWLMMRLAEDTLYHFDREHPRALYRVHQSQTSKSPEGDQHDFRLMGQDLICRHSALYRQLLLDPEIPRGGTPEEERLIIGLCGLAAFLNQQHPAILRRMTEHAVAAHPEDWGAREILLTILQRDEGRFQQEYRRAMRDFADDADARYTFTNLAVGTAQQRGVAVDRELMSRFQELHRICHTPPEIVKANVPAVKKSSFSWKIPDLKI